MADCLKSLYAVDELLLQKKKIYIWGYHEAASGLFVKLCALSVKVDGFIDNEYAGTTLWNRPVLAEDDVDVSDTVVCISDIGDLQNNRIEKYLLCDHPVILNPEFDKRQAIIYGAGKTGRQVLDFLHSVGIEVLCFIDSNRERIGNKIEGIPVEDVSLLKQLPVSAYVIEAGYSYIEMDETVTKYIGIKKRFYWEKPLDNTRLEILNGLSMFLPDVMGFQECFEDKMYYLYGPSETIKKSQAVLELLGIQSEEIVDYYDGAECKCLEDLLYEDNYLVLVADIKKAEERGRRLECLGMREGIEYIDIKNPSLFYSLSRTSLPDLNLSYTYIMGDGYPGFQVLGENKETDYKIVLLGGSTTDGGLGVYKSWADFLYEQCAPYHVTIFNGGISGYTSTQELVKLLRDVLNLKPDMVIVYDGVNDANNNYKGKPYNFKYLEQVFSSGRGKNSLLERDDLQINTHYLNAAESFAIWISNIEIMHVIAQSKNISFFSFLQPMLASKKREFLTIREKGYIGICSLCYKRYLSDGFEYRRLIKEQKITDTHDYVFDLSDIFDEKDVYVDVCHVCEDGNRIIAEKIWNEIKGRIS